MKKIKQILNRHWIPTMAGILSIMILIAGSIVAWRGTDGFWVRQDHRGQILMDRQDFKKAAETFRDPLRQGIALYRDGDFEQAEATFASLPGPEAAFNQANSLIMMGKYEQAIERFDRALELKPQWPAAITNREIARIRAERVKQQGGDMTGGQMGADDIVFDQSKSPATGEQEIVAQQPLSDEEMRQTWLRQVETTPAQFLQAKFAFQASKQSNPGENNGR